MAFNRTDTTAVDKSATAQGALHHIDMLEKLRDMAINQSADGTSLAIATAGSGYAAGDIVEVTDAASSETFPSSHPTTRATIEVITVSGGVPQTIRLRNAGVYTALPTNNGTADEYNTTALSGGGSGLTVDLTFASNGWSVTRETSEVASATVNAGGSGYVNGETVTLTDSGNERTAATATLTVSGGAITGFTITDGGIYDILPATLDVTGGSGTGGIANATYSAVTDLTVERELIMTSSASVIAAIRTVSDGSTYFSWELSSFPTYVAENSFLGQPQINPGHHDVTADGSGHYVFLRDTDPTRWNWFLNINARRIIGVMNIDNGFYNQFYLGEINPYATSTEHPYPVLVHGCSSQRNLNVTSPPEEWAGPPQSVSQASGDDYGPGILYDPGGTWVRVRNGNALSGTVRGHDEDIGIWPCRFNTTGNSTDVPPITEDNQITPLSGVSATPQNITWADFAYVDTDSPPDQTIMPAPVPAGEQPVLWECYLAQVDDQQAAFGEMDSVRWVERTVTGDQFSSEDEVYVGDDIWLIFRSGNLSSRQHFFAMKLSP